MRNSAPSTFALAVLATITFGGIAAAQDNWAQFRGPTMNATVADNPALPERWSQTENVEWVTEESLRAKRAFCTVMYTNRLRIRSKLSLNT